MAPFVPRLKTRPEFLRVASARNKWVTPGLILQARPQRAGTPDVDPRNNALQRAGFRVGFTVSRKVGNAVARNRAKRRLRTVVEQVMPVCAKDGFDFVVIGRTGTLTRPFPALLKDLKASLKRLDAFRDDASATGGTEDTQR